MTDAVIVSVAEVAGARRARAFEGVNRAVRVEMAASLVGGNTGKTNKEFVRIVGFIRTKHERTIVVRIFVRNGPYSYET